MEESRALPSRRWSVPPLLPGGCARWLPSQENSMWRRKQRRNRKNTICATWSCFASTVIFMLPVCTLDVMWWDMLWWAWHFISLVILPKSTNPSNHEKSIILIPTERQSSKHLTVLLKTIKITKHRDSWETVHPEEAQETCRVLAPPGMSYSCAWSDKILSRDPIKFHEEAVTQLK